MSDGKRRFRPSRRPGGSKVTELDRYLESKNMWRKHIAKDGSCLFRAVAEQVYLSQVEHLQVRGECIDYIRENQTRFKEFLEESVDSYLFKLRHPACWAGEIELAALAAIYHCKIEVYHYQEEHSTQVGLKKFGSSTPGGLVVRLAYSDGNHYDSIMMKDFRNNSAICQSILYELLFKAVFKAPVPNRKDLQTCTRRSDYSMDANLKTFSADDLMAFSSKVYFNAAIGVHKTFREDLVSQDWHLAMAMQFMEGDECQVWIEHRKEKKIFDGVIRATNSSLGKHRVFIFDLNKTVDIKHQDFNVLSLVGGRKSASQKHPDWFKHASSKKKTGDKSSATSRAAKAGTERSKTSEKVAAPFLQSSHRKRRNHSSVGHSQNEPVDPELLVGNAVEQLRLIELQDKDNSFPALSSSAVKAAGDLPDQNQPITSSSTVVTMSNMSVFNTIVTSSLPSSVVPKVKPLHQSKQPPKQPLSASTITQTPAWQPKTNHNSNTLFSSVRDSSSSPVTSAEELSSVKSPTVTTSAATITKPTTVAKKGSHSTAQASSIQHTSADVAKQLAKAINKEKENQQVSERQLLSLSMTATLTDTSQQQHTSWPELLSQDEQKAMPLEQQKLAPRSFHGSVSKSPLQVAPIVSSMIRMPSTAANPAITLPSYFAATQAPPTQATPTVLRGSSVTVTSHKPLSAAGVTQATTTPASSRAYIPSLSVPTSAVRVTGSATPSSSSSSSTLAPIAARAAVTMPPHVGTLTFNLEMPSVHLPQPPFQLYGDGENNLFFEEYGRMCFETLLDNSPGIAHVIHGAGAARSHVHDIDYSEEEKRLIEEQSQRLETWKKSPSGVIRTLKDLQGSHQSEEYPPQPDEYSSQLGEYPPQSGECSIVNLSAQPTSENTRNLQIVFPAQQQQQQQQQQQPLNATREDLYLKKLNKEELEMLQSLMKKMDLQQQQPTADIVAIGGTSSDETVSAHTTSSLPQSDTEGTPSTASESAMQLAPPTQSAPEPYSNEIKSAGSPATSPDEVQTTGDEVDEQETTEQEDNTEKQREEISMEQHGSLDGDGLVYPGMMAAPNPMATMAAIGHFLPPPAPAAATGFMLPPPMMNPYLFQQLYFQMMQQQQAHMMMQQSMAAAAIATSPTPNNINDEDYQQKNSEELLTTVPQDAHQAEVSINAVEVVSSNDHPNEEQLRGHSPPAEVHTNFSPIQNSFSTPPVDSLPEATAVTTLKQQALITQQQQQALITQQQQQALITQQQQQALITQQQQQALITQQQQQALITQQQQQDVIPPSYTNSLSPPHSTLLSNDDAINHPLLLPSTVSQPASSSTLKQPKATTPESLPVQQHKKVHNSSSEHFTIINSKLTTSDTQKVMPQNFARQHKSSSPFTTSSGRTNNSTHMSWKQQHASKEDKHNYATKAPHYYSQYDGETIDHELSQMGMNNSFPNGIPSMMFSSERRKPQT